MLMHRRRLGLAILLTLSTAIVCRGQEPGKAEAKGGKLNDLLKERLEVARANARLVMEAHKSGTVTIDEIRKANRLLVRAELDACDSDKARIAVLEKAVTEARKLEEMATHLAKAGQAPMRLALTARADRLHAEIALERAKAKPAGQAALDARDAVALAESEVAIKRAAVKVAEAQRKIALAKLATVKAELAGAQAAESYARLRLTRITELVKSHAITENLVDEQRENLETAEARRTAVERKVTEVEGEVGLEHARVEMAQAEVQHAELRLNQLKAPR